MALAALAKINIGNFKRDLDGKLGALSENVLRLCTALNIPPARPGSKGIVTKTADGPSESSVFLYCIRAAGIAIGEQKQRNLNLELTFYHGIYLLAARLFP